MITIAIDLNDVIRDYSSNFLRYYMDGYNHEFDLTDFEFWSHDMRHVFTFSSDESYYNFCYNDYVFELYGKCDTCSRRTPTELKEWINKTVGEGDFGDDVNVIIVSSREYGLSIGNTLFFISKLGINVREFYFPEATNKIWERCDVLITANPELLDSKPEGKTSVKIKTDYNKENAADYEYPTFSSFVSDEENTKKLIM